MSHGSVFPWSRRRFATASLCAALLAACSASPEAMVASAREYLAKNDVNAAGIQLKNALQENGKLPEARFLMGVVNLEQGNAAGAVKELRRATDLGIPQERVDPLLARAMVQLGEFDEVFKEFAAKTLADPAANAQLRTALGDAYLARVNVAKAREQFEAALRSNPEDAAARVGIGRVKLISGDREGAMAEADAVLAKSVSSAVAADAHALRADVFIVTKRPDQAITALVEAVQARPAATASHFALVSLLLDRGDAKAAEERIVAMEKIAPTHPLTHFQRGRLELAKGNAKAAREHAGETLRLAPNYLPGRLLAGMAHLKLNEHVQAQGQLAAVLARAPQHRIARQLLAESELATGNPDKAMETLGPLLSEASEKPEVLQLAARIHVARGNMEAASAIYEKLVAVRPDDERLRTQLGVARLLEGDAGAGLNDLETAAGLEGSSGTADFALVMVHLRQGEVDKAMAAQRRLEEKRPTDPRTFLLKGGVLLASMDQAGARKAFEHALSLDANYLPAAVNLARMDVADKRPQDAIERIEAIVRSHPDNVAASLFLANLQRATGAGAERVRETLERASEANPNSTVPRLALVRESIARGDVKKAVSLAQEIAGAHPAEPAVLEMLGQAQGAAGEYLQALATYQKLANLQPRRTRPLILLAEMQRVAKDVRGAEQSLRRALALKPDLFEAQQRLTVLLATSGKHSDALGIARSVQKREPKSPAGWDLEGDVLLLSKDYPGAVTAFRKAATLARTPDSVIKLHIAQTGAGKPAEAEKTAAEWLAGHADDLKVRGYLAERALADGRLEDAERLYRKLDELRPNVPQVLNNLAWIAGRRKDPQALALAERAAGLAPDNPAVLDTLGVLQVEGGQTEKGIENQRRAVALAPTISSLRMNLARTYASAGRKAEAAKEADALLQNLPENSPLRAEATALKNSL